MSNLRFEALTAVRSREPHDIKLPDVRFAEIFGSNVFGVEAQRKHLSEATFKYLQGLNQYETIDRKVADEVANAMKSWALSRGITHYTHWFQPLTGLTAEKHDAFYGYEKGKAIEQFSGSELAQQEPDASSLPSGGIRSTFEARGYSAWDPSSPAFIFGTTLCIPSIFISYTGEALDYKAPLLRSVALIDKAATDVCNLFDKEITNVSVTLGPEQEYFLVDAAFFNARPDLLLSGRSVFGAGPARGQQLEDHYFGAIPTRVMNFMIEVEVEALKLGIPLKTRHNEVAPGQYECAPIFEELNISVDHNLLLMNLMDAVAQKHGLRVLFHEKPFAGINGSGKHNNWSLGTNTGKNLLSPGKTPKENTLFLTFLINTLKAIHSQDDLLRASIATIGNEHRLGANEAPPAIISVFLGRELDRILNEMEDNTANIEINSKTPYKLGIKRLPEVLKDNTDRNRTSPFAFTGNKFEFRAVGASANNSLPMTTLNTIVANQLLIFKKTVDEKIAAGANKDTAVLETLRQYLKESKAIRFEGDGYGQEWRDEAARRGLNNVVSVPLALDFWVTEKAHDVFVKNEILSERELHARHEIQLESYIKKMGIEAYLIRELALNQIVPAAWKYQRELLQNLQMMKELGMKKGQIGDTIDQIAHHIDKIYDHLEKLDKALEAAEAEEDTRKKAIAFREDIFMLFDPIRKHVDALEGLVADEHWPLPKYREMLFLR
jgi:glutamine synthetase